LSQDKFTVKLKAPGMDKIQKVSLPMTWYSQKTAQQLLDAVMKKLKLSPPPGQIAVLNNKAKGMGITMTQPLSTQGVEENDLLAIDYTHDVGHM
jgi:hypothetical protein